MIDQDPRPIENIEIDPETQLDEDEQYLLEGPPPPQPSFKLLEGQRRETNSAYDDLLNRLHILDIFPKEIYETISESLYRNARLYIHATERISIQKVRQSPMYDKFFQFRARVLERAGTQIQFDKKSFDGLLSRTIGRYNFEVILGSPGSADFNIVEILHFIQGTLKTYEEEVRGLLDDSLIHMSDVLKMDLKDSKGEVNNSLLNTKIKIIQMLDKRVYGDYVQRVDQRNTTTVTHKKSSGGGEEVLSLEDITRKKLELESQRKLLENK